MSDKTHIYGLIDPRTQELRYIGKADNLDKRLHTHLNSCILENNHKSNWIRSLRNAGLVPEIFEIETVSINDWQEAERFWIRYFRYIGCNLTNGNDGGIGGVSPTQEVRDKLRSRMSGKKRHPGFGLAVSRGKVGKKPNRVYRFDPEHQKRMVELALTPEAREKQRKSAKERANRPENIAKMTLSNPAGRPEVRAKISDAAKGRTPWIKGKKHSEESKRKMSEAAKLRWKKDKAQP